MCDANVDIQQVLNVSWPHSQSKTPAFSGCGVWSLDGAISTCDVTDITEEKLSLKTPSMKMTSLYRHNNCVSVRLFPLY